MAHLSCAPPSWFSAAVALSENRGHYPRRWTVFKIYSVISGECLGFAGFCASSPSSQFAEKRCIRRASRGCCSPECSCCCLLPTVAGPPNLLVKGLNSYCLQWCLHQLDFAPWSSLADFIGWAVSSPSTFVLLRFGNSSNDEAMMTAEAFSSSCHLNLDSLFSYSY